MKEKEIKFIDLFAGMGGIRLGFEQAFNEKGFKTKCVMTSEIKEAAIKTLKYNFEQDNLVGDISKIESSSIPDFDFLLAGFPCQAFSSAGKGLGFTDTRGTLFFQVERILKDKQPYGFILENVEGLVLHDREKTTDKIGRTLTIILNALEKLNYKVQWKVLDCSNFGVPQARRRIFIVGTKDRYVDLNHFPIIHKVLGDILEKDKPIIDSKFTKCLLSHYKISDLEGMAIKDKRGGNKNIHSWDIELKGPITASQKILIEKMFKERRKKHWAEEIQIDWMDGMPLTLDQIKTFHKSDNLLKELEDLVKKGYLVKEYPKILVDKTFPDGTIHKVRKQDSSKEIGYNIVAGKLSFEFTKILDSKEVTPTLVAADVSHLGIVDGKGIRQLTVREGLRLFGYPENYHIMTNEKKQITIAEAFDLLGNTVVVPVVKTVASKLCDCYSKEGEPYNPSDDNIIQENSNAKFSGQLELF